MHCLLQEDEEKNKIISAAGAFSTYSNILRTNEQWVGGGGEYAVQYVCMRYRS